MSLFTGVTATEKIGGIFGLSSYLLLSDKIRNYIPEGWPNKETPIFMGHGDSDQVVKYDFGKMSADMLREMGMKVDFNTYK